MAKATVGIGWRPELHSLIAQRTDIDFVEVLAEATDIDPLANSVDTFKTAGVPIYLHGTGLSLGSAEPPSKSRVEFLQDRVDALDSPLVSEHIAFTRTGDINAGHLLPIPRTFNALTVFVENYRIASEQLSVPLVLENVASFYEWPDNEMSELDFVQNILDRTGATLLLDISNLFANGRNNDFDPLDALDQLDLERVACIHVAGGLYKRDNIYHDTHCHPILEQVWQLLEVVLQKRPDVPVMIERDGNFENYDLDLELDELKRITNAFHAC